jgi:hypothetical protein
MPLSRITSPFLRTNTSITSPAANTVAITTASTERLRVTSAGNVGIGTSSPQAILDLNRNFDGEIGAFIRNPNAGGYVAVRLGNSDRSTNGDHLIYGSSTLGMRSKTGAAITFEPAGTERMRIDSAGNVGIGTSSPTERLHVNGSVTVSGRISRNSGGFSSTDTNIRTLFSPSMYNSGLLTVWNSSTPSLVNAHGVYLITRVETGFNITAIVNNSEASITQSGGDIRLAPTTSTFRYWQWGFIVLG